VASTQPHLSLGRFLLCHRGPPQAERPQRLRSGAGAPSDRRSDRDLVRPEKMQPAAMNSVPW
jgi:hypothetical protein